MSFSLPFSWLTFAQFGVLFSLQLYLNNCNATAVCSRDNLQVVSIVCLKIIIDKKIKIKKSTSVLISSKYLLSMLFAQAIFAILWYFRKGVKN